MTTSYAGLLRRCETDPDVVGLVLSGSHARNMATEHSDFDDGQIAELVHAQATLTPTESDTLVREQLDGYINCAGNSTLTRCLRHGSWTTSSRL